MTKLASYQECKFNSTCTNQINAIKHINKLEDRNYKITILDIEKAFEDTQNPSMMKVLKELLTQ